MSGRDRAALACPFCGAACVGSGACTDCGKDPTGPRRVCGRCGVMSPSSERRCRGCGASIGNGTGLRVAIVVAVFIAAGVLSVALQLA